MCSLQMSLERGNYQLSELGELNEVTACIVEHRYG